MPGGDRLDGPPGIARPTANAAVAQDMRKEAQVMAAQLPELWEWAEYY